MICGALTWLRNHKHQDLEAQLEDADNDGADEPEWVREFARKEKKEKLLRSRAELEERLKAIREKETQEKARFEATEKRGFKRMVSRGAGVPGGWRRAYGH